jgi:hypothetical protein
MARKRQSRPAPPIPGRLNLQQARQQMANIAAQNNPQNMVPQPQSGATGMQALNQMGGQGNSAGISLTPLPKPGFFSGQGPQYAQFQRNTPAQQSLISMLSAQIPGILQQATAPNQRAFDFEPIAREETQRFQQDILQKLFPQFSGGGLTSSGSYQAAKLQSGEGLANKLAALRSQVGLEQQKLGLAEKQSSTDLLRLLASLGLAPQFEGSVIGAQPGFAQSLLSPLAGVAGYAAGGPAGGFLGNFLGNLAKPTQL